MSVPPPPPPFATRLHDQSRHESQHRTDEQIRKTPTRGGEHRLVETSTGHAFPEMRILYSPQNPPLDNPASQTPLENHGRPSVRSSYTPRPTPATAMSATTFSSRRPSIPEESLPRSLHAHAGQAPCERQDQVNPASTTCEISSGVEPLVAASPITSTFSKREAQHLTPHDTQHQLSADAALSGLGIVDAFVSHGGGSNNGLPTAQSLHTPFFKPPTQAQSHSQPMTYTPLAASGVQAVSGDALMGISSQHTALHAQDSIYTYKQKRWTRDEDLCLLAAVKQHGEQWKVVTADLNKAGGTLRTISSVSNRYDRLKLQYLSAARPVVAPPSSSSGFDAAGSGNAAASPASTAAPPDQHQNQQHLQLQQEVMSVAARRSAAGAATWSRWTRKEDETLVARGRAGNTGKRLFDLYRQAFPGTTRTPYAVDTRWRKTLQCGQAYPQAATALDPSAVTLPALPPAGPSTAPAPLLEGQNDLARAAQLAASAAHMLRSGTTCSEPRRVEAALESPLPHLDCTTTRPMHALEYEPLVMTPSSFPAAEASTNASQAIWPSVNTATAPDSGSTTSLSTRYFIETLPNGFFVRNLPPLHELHIHTPTLCEVVKAEAGPTLPVVKVEEGSAQHEQPTAPFVFKVGATGFINALRLPLGTETTISFDDEEGEEEGAAEDGSIVLTVFATVDAYEVTFVTRARS